MGGISKVLSTVGLTNWWTADWFFQQHQRPWWDAITFSNATSSWISDSSLSHHALPRTQCCAHLQFRAARNSANKRTRNIYRIHFVAPSQTRTFIACDAFADTHTFCENFTRTHTGARTHTHTHTHTHCRGYTDTAMTQMWWNYWGNKLGILSYSRIRALCQVSCVGVFCECIVRVCTSQRVACTCACACVHVRVCRDKRREREREERKSEPER